ncbi:MAG: NTPase [Chloroflexota bacterium]
MKRAFLLSGRPGTGKTTIIKQAMCRSGRSAGGFYTTEIRSGGVRKGFNITTLDGDAAVLAHVEFNTPNRIGKYGVDIDALDRVGVAAVKRAIAGSELVVIDEIGKMELLSSEFRKVVLQAMDSGKPILGSLLHSPNAFVDGYIRHRPEVTVRTITEANRDAILGEVLRWLDTSRNAY